MTARTGPRPGGRSARVQEAVHDAVRRIQREGGHEGLTVPAIAALAGVTPSTIYRRWGELAQLLSDVAVENLRPETAPPDTGSFRRDVEAWVTQYLEEMSSELGGRMLRDVLGSTDRLNAHTCVRLIEEQFDVMRERARARGEETPPNDILIDRVVAPLIYRVLFATGKPPPSLARDLLCQVFGAGPEGPPGAP